MALALGRAPEEPDGYPSQRGPFSGLRAANTNDWDDHSTRPWNRGLHSTGYQTETPPGPLQVCPGAWTLAQHYLVPR